jgi:hypothetical protein
MTFARLAAGASILLNHSSWRGDHIDMLAHLEEEEWEDFSA